MPAHEIRWEPSPCNRNGGDYLRLLEIVPGHYLFRSSDFASDLCKLVGTDLRSQFYKTPAIGNLLQSPEPLWSGGNCRTIKRLEIYACRRQTRAKDNKEQKERGSPEVILTGPSHPREPGQSTTNTGELYAPQVPKPPEFEAIPHDDNL